MLHPEAFCTIPFREYTYLNTFYIFIKRINVELTECRHLLFTGGSERNSG